VPRTGRTIVGLALSLALTVGCGDGGGHDTRAVGAPHAGDMSCSNTSFDDYRFEIEDGQHVEIDLETPDPATAGDFALFGTCGALGFAGDDERSCGASDFRCPSVRFSAKATTSCFLRVTIPSARCQDIARPATYVLDVRIGGVPTLPTLVSSFDGVPIPSRPDLDIAEDITPCGEGLGDEWTFDVTTGDTIVVAVDTIDLETAADLAFNVTCGATPVPVLTLFADDEFACTFPPPAYGCPIGSFIAATDATCTVRVSALGACANPGLARYGLGVERNGMPATLTLVGDDIFPPLPPLPDLSSSEDLTPCNSSAADVWQFDVAAGEQVIVGTDTVDSATSAFLFVQVDCANGAFGTFAGGERACSFPPPSGGCALASFDAPFDATCLLTVKSDVFSCTDPATARYRLGVTRGDAPAVLTLIDDDRLPPLPELTTSEDITPCDSTVLDQWQFPVAAGDAVLVATDTADPETAAILFFDVICDGHFVAGGEVQRPCRFPPPFGQLCPSSAFIAPEDATCTLTVTSAHGCTDPTTARYLLGVERNDVAAELTLLVDDQPPPVPNFTSSEDITPCRSADFVPGVSDVWQFDVAAGDAVLVATDTADAETAADLFVSISCDAFFAGTFGRVRECSFGDFSTCISSTFVADAASSCTAQVLSGFCTDGATARYRLGVERNGVAGALTLIADDQPFTFPGFAHEAASTSRTSASLEPRSHFRDSQRTRSATPAVQKAKHNRTPTSRYP